MIRGRSRRVDIESFKRRGQTKVNVINAREINELISQIVIQTISKLEDADVKSLKEDKAQIILESMNEFKRIMKERQNQEANRSDREMAIDEKHKQQQNAFTQQIDDLKQLLERQQLEAKIRENELRDVIAELRRNSAEPKRRDTGKIEKIIKHTMGDMMRQFEKSGMMKVAPEAAAEVGEKMADAVIAKTFGEALEGAQSANVKGKRVADGKGVLSNLQRLKSLKKK